MRPRGVHTMKYPGPAAGELVPCSGAQSRRHRDTPRRCGLIPPVRSGRFSIHLSRTGSGVTAHVTRQRITRRGAAEPSALSGELPGQFVVAQDVHARRAAGTLAGCWSAIRRTPPARCVSRSADWGDASGLDAGQVIRWKSWHRWTAICLAAYIYLAVAVAIQRQQEACSDLDAWPDPDHRPGTAAAPARHRHSATPARQGPPPALVHLTTPPPAPRPPGPPTLERLRRTGSDVTHVLQSVFHG